jgi:hypothetical protein
LADEELERRPAEAAGGALLLVAAGLLPRPDAAMGVSLPSPMLQPPEPVILGGTGASLLPTARSLSAAYLLTPFYFVQLCFSLQGAPQCLNDVLYHTLRLDELACRLTPRHHDDLRRRSARRRMRGQQGAAAAAAGASGREWGPDQDGTRRVLLRQPKTAD